MRPPLGGVRVVFPSGMQISFFRRSTYARPSHSLTSSLVGFFRRIIKAAILRRIDRLAMLCMVVVGEWPARHVNRRRFTELRTDPAIIRFRAPITPGFFRPGGQGNVLPSPCADRFTPGGHDDPGTETRRPEDGNPRWRRPAISTEGARRG